MSVTTTMRRSGPTPGQRLRYAITDGAIAARRNLIQIVRVPTVLVFELVQPIMFVLLFRYVYQDAFTGILPPGIDYVLFLMPGIFVQNAVFGSTTTAIGLAEDLKKGLVDRFRSLPMARSAVLVGRTTADLIKNLALVTVMIAMGYGVGFRFSNGIVPALGVVVLVLAIGFAFSWISATIGLALKEVEAVQAATFTWIFPVVFVSSVFVPVRGMASFLEVIARNNPMTHWANLARYLAIGEQGITDPFTKLPVDTLEGLVLKSALWLAGILIVFIPLAIRLYRRLT
jgi:ABC-2 type transport system permease protein/oleandomycin transport system permease protein